MNALTYYLETMGCQMNLLDSELVETQLRAMGYRPAADPAAADLILLNTCSVRRHAEDKVYSRLGSLRAHRKKRPDLIVGVIGCMAERDPEGLLAGNFPVDLLCGPGELNRIPALIAEVRENRTRPVALTSDHSRATPVAERTLQFDSIEALDLGRQPAPGTSVLQSYIRVQRGCDKFCTFCVVPFTRGPERSRPPEHIVTEAKILADRGAKEVTLLGQTINSYACKENGRTIRFAELLARVNDVPGLQRIRFVTSFPGDFDDEILAAMRNLPKVCEYLHIPAQSGSNAILKRMRRQYTVEQYVELVDRARDIVPDISLAGDFIVGFGGETDDDFHKTLDLVERIQYKNLFIFKYSPRPGTKADNHLPDDIPPAIKRRRNVELLKVQEAISLKNNRKRIGSVVEVLVEGYSKAAIKAQAAEHDRGQEIDLRVSNQLVGRTRQDQIVVFEGQAALIGRLINVRISAATALTLHGRPLDTGAGSAPDSVSLPVVA